jgi:NADH-ubiquinone oxidoreductase chain 5
MEGPTPVSALIHAATLVTAGIFLLIRCSFIFEYSRLGLFIVLIIGGLTSLFGASTALLQNDIKKIIAFSTTSQLGYMAFSCGISTYNIAFFHLINHAFFKSLLFLSAGSIIHAMSNDQDLRKFGGLITFLPFTYGVMVIGFLALCGFPFLSGFYSKEIIIETSYSFYSFSCNLTYWLGTVVAAMTSFYSFRCLTLVFFGNINSSKYMLQNLSELSSIMGFSLFFLALGSIFTGYLLKDNFLGLGSTF